MANDEGLTYLQSWELATELLGLLESKGVDISKFLPANCFKEEMNELVYFLYDKGKPQEKKEVRKQLVDKVEKSRNKMIISITKNHYELQVRNDGYIKLTYFTDTQMRKNDFSSTDSENGKKMLDKFNNAYPKTSFTPDRFPSENLHIYN